jgi:hypothetical protein
MYKSYLRARETWAMPAALVVLMSCLWLPAARGDIFVSNGAGGPYASQVWSYSQYTGAYKLTFSGGLASSNGLAFGIDGNLYVADGVNKQVLYFNPSTGALIGTFVHPIGGNAYPFGITFVAGGALYMADNSGFIRVFDPTGLPLGTYVCYNPSGVACYPFDLTFGPDGYLYVSDLGSRSVLQFSTAGGTVAFKSVFVPAFPDTGAFPWGLHFGPNGNLYVDFSLTIPNTNGYYYSIFEYNGSTGAPVSFSVPYSNAGQADFAFGPDTEIYVAGDPAFTRYISSTGGLVGTFGSTGLPPAPPGFITMGGPTGSPPYLPPYLLYTPVGLDPTQTIRITVIEGPVKVPPGVPVQAQLGFQNSAGLMVGPSQVISLNPGQTASLDLAASTLISSGRIELQPVVTALPGTPLGSLQGSVEVFNTSNGVGSVFYPGIPVPPASSITGSPSFVPQGVVLGQSMQINAAAPPDSPCVALLSFANKNGKQVGPTQQVNLSPGTMASLSFNTNPYTKSGREEFVPQITPNNPTGGPGVAPACLGSAEVFIQKSGNTSTYQTSSPAVGTSPAVAP